MVASNSDVTRRSKRISPGSKKIKKLNPVTADHKLQNVLDGLIDTKQGCMGNYKNVSETLEQMSQFYAATPWIENQLDDDMIDSCKIEETSIKKPLVFSVHPYGTVGEKYDIHNLMNEETHAQLKANIKILQIENSMSCREIRAMSESCLQLQEENRTILSKLKKWCTTDTIAYLKKENPDKKCRRHGSSEVSKTM